MNAVQTFTFDVNSITHGIRLVEIDGAPWFVVADVCQVLKHSNPSKVVSDLCTPGQSRIVARSNLPSGYDWPTRGRLAVSEGGLYALVMGSRTKAAQAFKAWVTDSVLPSIRKNGGYIAGQEKLASGELSDAEFRARSHLVALRIIESITAERDAAHLFDIYSSYGVQ